ncbi:MAG: hypothetical protein ACE37F_02130 [Nannocystaceae bacterium]|nr:hypothetical protein [bacterium]
MRHVSLSWYDLAEVHAAHDALWRAIARRLRDAGVRDVPGRLERHLDYVAQWNEASVEHRAQLWAFLESL